MKKEIELILDSTHDAMIAVDTDGIVTIFNKAAGRLMKIDPDLAVGRPVEEVVPNTRLNTILKTGALELNRRQPLGDTTIITNRMPVKNDMGEIIGAIAVFRDISEVLELAEEITNLTEIRSTLEAIFNATQDAISVVDQNGINVLINPAYTRLTGYTPKDVIGKLCTADLADGDSVHLKVLETKEPVKGMRIRVGPTKREVIVEAAPIIVNDELRGSVAVIHDLTEINRLMNALDQAKQIIRNLEAKYTFSDIIGSSVKMEACVEKARMAALTPATIILRGESGTGKELFAHAIHNASSRKFAQFIRVNCAAINENILESELFGYDEGAFTGAVKGGKVGFFEKADGGTLFLDEIGEISMQMQTKLLRVLQEKEIVRVGGTKAIPIDVRIISATNADLEKMIEEGRFRQDLYYRLNVFPIQIPPLREHKEDIYELVMLMINKYNQEYGRSVHDFSKDALDIMFGYAWPGNVRELENFVGRAMINMSIIETRIESHHLPVFPDKRAVELSILELMEKAKSQTLAGMTYEDGIVQTGENAGLMGADVGLKGNDVMSVGLPEGLGLDEAVAVYERKVIEKVLADNGGNREMAARQLGISLRTLYYKMKRVQ